MVHIEDIICKCYRNLGTKYDDEVTGVANAQIISVVVVWGVLPPLMDSKIQSFSSANLGGVGNQQILTLRHSYISIFHCFLQNPW